MKGNMKVWILWVWWFVVVGPARIEGFDNVWTVVSPLMVLKQHTLRYGEVNFTTVMATKDSYTQFIEDLRGQLASRDERHEIPVLRDPSTVLISKRFLLVKLSNWAERSITLAIDVTNVYVVAYQAGDQSYFFRDAPVIAFSSLFTDTEQHTLAFGGSYRDLERTAGALREEINLGINELEEAISTLSWTINNIAKESTLARSLIVSIQMVSEAVRFKYIEQLVRQSIGSDGHQSFSPDAAMLRLENNWGALSKAIQQSNQGVFSAPVQLKRRNYSTLEVNSVADIEIRSLAIMKFICRDRASQIRMIIGCVADDDDNTCAVPEPTVRIRGRNGLCVDVKDGLYNDGNPIQLWPCKKQLDVNQLWTIKTDGTIRSNGRCMITNGNSPASHVVIDDCNCFVTAAIRWQVWDDGTIINPQSGLALSAQSGNIGTELTGQINNYEARQAWLPGNHSEPFVTSIVGLNDLCLQANGDAVWLEECASSKAEQQWAIHADGSIRPEQYRDSCLTCKNDSQGAISIVSCSPGGWTQRWVFKADGTILNLYNGLVMDVKQADPGLHQIIMWPFTGNPNQKWLPLL